MAKMITLFPENARWIWLPEKVFAQYCTSPQTYYTDRRNFNFAAALFEAEFTCREPQKLTALVTGDCRFRIYIDGEFWCDGPPEIGGDYNIAATPLWRFYEQKKLPESLQAGTHTILAEVTTFNELQSDISYGKGGFRLALFEDSELILASGENFRCRLNETYIAPRFLSFHEFQPTEKWYSAEPYDRPDERLLLSTLDEMHEFEVRPSDVIAPFAPERLENKADFLAGKAPLRIKKGEPYSFYLIFDSEYAALLAMQCNIQSSVEMFIEAMEIVDVPPTAMPCKERIVTLPGKFKWQSQNVYAVKAVKISVSFAIIGFPGFDDFILEDFKLLARHCRVNPPGSFDCSDRRYKNILECCQRTLKLCKQRMHWDSPVHQECLGCIGDYRFEALQGYTVFGEYKLARMDLQRIAMYLNLSGGKLFHTGFALFYPVMLHEYILYSGDTAVVEDKEIMSAVQTVLELFSTYLGSSGVISEAPNYMFIDWVSFRNMFLHHPSAAVGMAPISAFYASALAADCQLALYQHDKVRAEKRQHEFNELKANFNKLFYRPEMNCYINGIPHLSKIYSNSWLPADDDHIAVTPHSSIAAVTAALAEKEDAADIIGQVLPAVLNREIQPYFCNFMFEAIFKSGRFNSDFKELMELYNQLYEDHPDSLKESWFAGDYSHAWSGAPAIWLHRGILGVQPLEPGFAKTLIAPHHAGLKFASGEVHTPQGMIAVEWQRYENHIELQICHPEGVECVVDTSGLADEQTEVKKQIIKKQNYHQL